MYHKWWKKSYCCNTNQIFFGTFSFEENPIDASGIAERWNHIAQTNNRFSIEPFFPFLKDSRKNTFFKLIHREVPFVDCSKKFLPSLNLLWQWIHYVSVLSVLTKARKMYADDGCAKILVKNNKKEPDAHTSTCKHKPVQVGGNNIRWYRLGNSEMHNGGYLIWVQLNKKHT